MKKIKKADIVIIAVLLAVIVFIAFMVIQGGKTESGQGGNDISPAASDETPKALTINDYSGRKIGVQTGTI